MEYNAEYQSTSQKLHRSTENIHHLFNYLPLPDSCGCESRVKSLISRKKPSTHRYCKPDDIGDILQTVSQLRSVSKSVLESAFLAFCMQRRAQLPSQTVDRHCGQWPLGSSNPCLLYHCWATFALTLAPASGRKNFCLQTSDTSLRKQRPLKTRFFTKSKPVSKQYSKVHWN